MGLARLFRTGIAFGFVLIVISINGFADDKNKNTDIVQAHFEQIQQWIFDLRDKDPFKRSNAASNLAACPFEETKEALISALERESVSFNPNSFVIKASFGSLQGMLDQKDIPRLVKLRDALAEKPQPWMNKRVNQLEGLIAEAENSIVPINLPHLPSTKGGEDELSFLDKVKKSAVEGKIHPALADAIFGGTEKDISHDMSELAKDPSNPTIIGREKVAERALKIMVRMKGRIPVLVGGPGVGKTAVAQAIALAIKKNNLAPWFVFEQEFPQGTVVLQTSASRIGRLARSDTDSAQAAALELYLDAIKSIQKLENVPIILFMDEFHTLNAGQEEALKPYGDELGGIRILGATNPNLLELMIGNDDAKRRRYTPVPVEELSLSETEEVLRQGWLRQIERRYRVEIPDELLETFIKIATEVRPDLARPEAPIKFLQDLAIHISHGSRPAQHEATAITEEMARKYAGDITGIPINPRDPKALLEYIEKGRGKIKERVKGQGHVVDTLVDTWMDVLTSDAQRAWRSIVIVGTTGTGKSLSAKALGEVFLGSREKVLTVDCTAYLSGDVALNSLLGAPNGIISSDKTKGVLPEFLTGAGKESGIIIFNEFDKAHPDLAKRIMEMIDRGELTGGDGHIYRLRRHQIVFTTNRGASKIFNEKLGHLLTSEELSHRVKQITDSQARAFFSQSEGYALLDENRLPPEVVNRIDRWVVAKPIVFEDALEIANLKVETIARENIELHKLHIKVTPDLIREITRVAFTPSDGARPVEKRIESILNRARALVWANVDQVTGAEIGLQIHKTEDGKARVQIVDLKETKLIGELPFDEPTKFMALKDPRFMEILMGLEGNLKKEIFGQDEAMEEVAKAVRARANRPLDAAPLSIGLFGSTGVGKTETAKVLAKYLYGSADRAQIIPFGKINHRYELNDIFGPPTGIIGSESKKIFEQILESFPEGAVIVLDEISNMGQGATPQEKESLFKTMYEIFGEGRWTNSHGKTYDLANFTFILTGNDGEKLFEGLPSEDMRTTVWGEHNSRESMKQLLRESHIPEAFLNRIDSLILMRPLADDIRPRVVNKFLSRLAKQLEEAHGVKIRFSEGFADRISTAFFPIGDGARGAERFTKTELSALIGDFIIKNYNSVQLAKRGEGIIEIDLELQYPQRYWAADELVTPSAQLHIKGTFPDSKSGQIIELSDSKKVEPTSPPQVNLRDVGEKIAVHESGHALVGLQLGNPSGEVRYITIESRGGYGGYAGYKPVKKFVFTDLSLILKQMAVSAAGSEAQVIFSGGKARRDAGWKSDRGKLNQMAFQAVVDFGLIEGLEFLPPDEKGKPSLAAADSKTRALVMAASRKLVEGSIRIAREVLSDTGVQSQMQRVVTALIEKGAIRGAEFIEVAGDYRVDESKIENLLAQIEEEIVEIEQAAHNISCVRRLTNKGAAKGSEQ